MPVVSKNNTGVDLSKLGFTEVQTHDDDLSKFGFTEVKKKVGGNNLKNGVQTPSPIPSQSPSPSVNNTPTQPSFYMPNYNDLAKGQVAPSESTVAVAPKQTLEAQYNKENIPIWNKEKADYKEKVIKNTPKAIENAAVKSLKIKGINPANKAQLNKEIQHFQNQIEDGNATVSFDKDGMPGLINHPNSWDSFHDNMMEAINENKESREYHSMNKDDRIKFLNSKLEEKPSPYLGTKSTGFASVTGMAGSTFPTLGLYAAGAATGGLLEMAQPETGGLSGLALKPVMSFVMNAGSEANKSELNGQLQRYALAKKNHPEWSDQEAYDEAQKGSDIDRLAGIGQAALFSETGGVLGKSVTKNFVKEAAKSGVDIGVKSAAIEGAKDVGHNMEGVTNKSSSDITADMGKAFAENAPMGTVLHAFMGAVTGITKIPALIKSGLKYDIVTKMKPEEVHEALQKNVESGAITPEQAQEAETKLNEYGKALNTVPPYLSDDVKASVTGLIEKRNNLEKQNEGLDKTAKELNQPAIDAIDNQIKEIYRTGKPLQHEVNPATGETFEKPTYDTVQKQRVQDVADKISKGKRIEDPEDLQAQANFPNELENELHKIKKSEAPKEDETQSDTFKNVNKYLKQNENEVHQSEETKSTTNETVSENSGTAKETQAEQQPIVDSNGEVDALKDVESTAKALDKLPEEQGYEIEGMANAYIKDVASKKLNNIIEETNLPDNIKAVIRERFSLNSKGEYSSSIPFDKIVKSGDIQLTKKFIKDVGAEMLRDKYGEHSNQYSKELDKLNSSIDDYIQSLLDGEEKGITVSRNADIAKVASILTNIQEKFEEADKSTPKTTSEAYHKAKKDGSNPELVKAVEDLIGKPENKKDNSVVENKKVEKPNKIVDESGKPLIVYHGTTADLSEGFKPTSFGSFGEHGFFYFAKDKNWVKKFGKEDNIQGRDNFKIGSYNLDIKNPLDIKDKIFTAKDWITYLEKNGVEISDKTKEEWERKSKSNPNRTLGAWQLFRHDVGTFRKDLKDSGFDGLIINDMQRGKTDNTVYVALDKEQIKSAIVENKKVENNQPQNTAIEDKGNAEKEFKDSYIKKLKKISPDQPEKWYKAQADANWELKQKKEANPEEKGNEEEPPSEPPSNEPPIEGNGGKKANIHSEYPPTSLSYRGTGKLETEFGISEREPTKTKHDLETIKEADQLLEKGWNVKDLLHKIEAGDSHISDAEYVNLTRYGAELSDRLRKLKNEPNSAEYDKTLNELKRVAAASDISGQQQGRALGIRGRFKTVPDGTYGEFMLDEVAANNDAPLTEKQKETANKDYTDFQNAKAKFEEDKAKFDEEVAKYKAEQELNKNKKTTPRNPKKSHEDFVKERKNIFEHAKEQLKKARGETSSTVIPYAKELIAIAPDVAKMVKSLVEEGVYKLADVVKTIHEQFKDEIPGIREKDIHDIIAGEYNDKKITKKEAAIKAENLRIEAQLLNKLDKLYNGEKPKNEKATIKRNQEIEELRKKIQSITKQMPADESSLKTLINKNEKETQKIKEKIAKGDFAPEEKKQPLLSDKELQKKFPETFKAAQKSRDALIKVKHDLTVRRLKQMYANKTSPEKAVEVFSKALNIPRTLMASMDLSAPLRQGIVATSAHPKVAMEALKFMLDAAKSEKVYNRWLEDVHNSDRWEAASKTGLAITDPESLHVKEKEEAYQGAAYVEKIPVIGAGVAASERAYVGYLNKLRWDLFNMYADRFEEQGKTFENNPDLYKGLSSFINSASGRGNMQGIEAAAPILNWFLFASRLISSRLNMLGLSDVPNLALRGLTLNKFGLDYGFYSKLPKELRIEAAKDMAKFVAMGVSTLLLAKAISNATGGNIQVETDPRSSDFGKIHSGNTRWDIWGGFQPYARVLTQTLKGERKATTTGRIYQLNGKGFMGEDRMSPLSTFAREKLAPIPGSVIDLIKHRDAVGQPATIGQKVLSDITPLIIQDVYSGMQDQGVKGLFTVGIPSAFGVGVQTYNNFPNKNNGVGGGGGASSEPKEPSEPHEPKMK